MKSDSSHQHSLRKAIMTYLHLRAMPSVCCTPDQSSCSEIQMRWVLPRASQEDG